MNSILCLSINFCLTLYFFSRYASGSELEICWQNVDCTVVKIFQTCFDDNENLPIVVIGKNDSVLRDLQSSSQPHQLALVNSKGSSYAPKEKLYLLEDYSVDAIPQPSTKFVFDEIDVTSLESAIRNVHESVWWNLFGNFVFKNTLTSNTCAHSYLYLKVAWKFDILRATYLCRNSLDEIEVHTFNPYTNNMSTSWEVVEMHLLEHDHPFTVFRLAHKFDVCNALTSDKTTSLGGYPIKLVAQDEPPLMGYDNETKVFGKVKDTMYHMALTKLNAAEQLIVYPLEQRGEIHANGTADGMLAEVLRGNYDCSLAFRTDESISHNQIYIYEQVKMCLVTRKQSLTAKLQLTKLTSIRAFSVCSCIFIGKTLTLMYINDVSFARAALDVLQLWLNMPTIAKPASDVSRLIFTLFLTSHIVWTNIQQADLYSAMTAPTYDTMARSGQELLDLNYKLYSVAQVRHRIFPDSSLYRQIEVVKSREECFRRAHDEYKSACIDQDGVIPWYINTRDSNTQIAEIQEYVKEYVVAVCRDNFSPLQRLSSSFAKIQEAGIYAFTETMKRRRYRPKFYDEAVEQQPLALDHMSFAFDFIVWGWAASAIALVVEVLLGTWAKRYH